MNYVPSDLRPAINNRNDRELLATPGLPVVDEQTAQALRSADQLLAFLEAAVPDSAFLPGPGMVLTDLTTLTEGACSWRLCLAWLGLA